MYLQAMIDGLWEVKCQLAEWSQNTVLLASTQAVYKAPHSTVRRGQRGRRDAQS